MPLTRRYTRRCACSCVYACVCIGILAKLHVCVHVHGLTCCVFEIYTKIFTYLFENVHMSARMFVKTKNIYKEIEFLCMYTRSLLHISRTCVYVFMEKGFLFFPVSSPIGFSRPCLKFQPHSFMLSAVFSHSETSDH